MATRVHYNKRRSTKHLSYTANFASLHETKNRSVSLSVDVGAEGRGSVFSLLANLYGKCPCAAYRLVPMDIGTGGAQGARILTFHKFVYKVPLLRLHSCPLLHVRVPPKCTCPQFLNALYVFGCPLLLVRVPLNLIAPPSVE